MPKKSNKESAVAAFERGYFWSTIALRPKAEREVCVIRAIDHIVILVTDLQTAIDDYRALGFTVTFGGEHADGNTHNALVPFADGSYFELIAFKHEAPNHRW